MVDLEIAEDIKKQNDELRMSEANRKKTFDDIYYSFMCVCLFIYAISISALTVYGWDFYRIPIGIYLRDRNHFNLELFWESSMDLSTFTPLLKCLGHIILYLDLNALR